MSGADDQDVIDAEVLPPDGGAGDDAAEVLPASRRTLATDRGRVFDADGHVEHDPDRWRPFGAGRGGQGGGRAGGGPRVQVRAQGGCAPGLLRWLGYLVGLVILGGVGLMVLGGAGWSVKDAVAMARESGPVAQVAVVLIVTLVTPLFVPSGLMAVLPGYVWGTAHGTALILAGAALGGLLNMWLARRMLGGRIEAVVDAAPVLRVLRETIRARGFRIALALRMSPVTPYSMLAYLAGVAGLSYGRFTLASVLGGIPWTSVYAMAGALLAATAKDLDLSRAPELGPETVWLRWLGLGFTVLVAVWIGRAARADLAKMRAETSNLR